MEEYQAKYLEVIEDMLGGLDEDIAAKYIGRTNLEAPYFIGWCTHEPWLVQLCRNIRELTLVLQDREKEKRDKSKDAIRNSSTDRQTTWSN